MAPANQRLKPMPPPYDPGKVTDPPVYRGDPNYGKPIPKPDDGLVVIPESNKPRYRRDQEAYLALCGSGAAKDIIVLTRAEFESSRRAASSLTSAVLSEGILLHESGNAS